MLEKNKRERIIALVNKEVVPAIGCTEPMAVALCTAKAAHSWHGYDRFAYRRIAGCAHRKA